MAENYLASCLISMLETNLSNRIFFQNVSPNKMSANILDLSEKIVTCDCSLLGVNTGEFFVDDALEKGLFNYAAVARFTFYKKNKIKCSIQNITCVNSNNKPELEIQEVDTPNANGCKVLPKRAVVVPPNKIGIESVESLVKAVTLSKQEQLKHLQCIYMEMMDNTFGNITELLNKNVIFDVTDKIINESINNIIHNSTQTSYCKKVTKARKDNVRSCGLSVAIYLCKAVTIVEDINDINYLLLYAIQNNSIDLAKIVLSKGAEINIAQKDKTMKYPMSLAVSRGSIDMIEFLLSQGADINGAECIRTPIWVAVDRGQIHIVNALLEKGADPNKNNTRVRGNNTILHAIHLGNYDIFACLIEKSTNIDFSCVDTVALKFQGKLDYVYNPLLDSLRHDLYYFTRLLLNKNASFNVSRHWVNNPLYITMTRKNKPLS
ncbi:MAG: ankyrin repeat domain-containing protein [Candidatus Endonucleobacter sp. (ex Gigantidas childressi)]|nr:ankyrin repeat domain-containing protein [Candidatus Endonucleobacter sp. (ex Gigantidas childressi)]